MRGDGHGEARFPGHFGVRPMIEEQVDDTYVMFNNHAAGRAAQNAEMLEALRSDYVKFARARGLPDRVVNFGHALRNTLVPVLTISGLQLGGLIAFSIITETVFAWPGMGSLFIQAVQFPDVPVMAAYLCLIALVFVAINLVVDLLYVVVDPRLRVNGAAAGTRR